jgi:hypothetical protein
LNNNIFKNNNRSIFGWILSKQNSISTSSFPTLEKWQIFVKENNQAWDLPVDRAISEGFFSDRVAYAFYAGFQAAFYYLLPESKKNTVFGFCVSEQHGSHPSKIKANLKKIPDSEKWCINGYKKFVSCALYADQLLVAASKGTNDKNKNILKIILLKSDVKGLKIEPMNNIPFIPEISHGIITFDNVIVDESQILPEDGYKNYIKPFRTIEDICIYAALLGYLFKAACKFYWPKKIKEHVLFLLTGIRSLSKSDFKDPAAHIVLGGFEYQLNSLFKELFSYWNKEDKEHLRWHRDHSIFNIAQNTKAKRLAAAWTKY